MRFNTITPHLISIVLTLPYVLAAVPGEWWYDHDYWHQTTCKCFRYYNDYRVQWRDQRPPLQALEWMADDAGGWTGQNLTYTASDKGFMKLGTYSWVENEGDWVPPVLNTRWEWSCIHNYLNKAQAQNFFVDGDPWYMWELVVCNDRAGILELHDSEDTPLHYPPPPPATDKDKEWT